MAASAAAQVAVSAATARPAILGGTPVRTAKFPAWPVFDQKEESAVTEVVRSGKWYRGNGQHVAQFERDFAALTGSKFALATANGTSAMIIAMANLGVGAGDEVLVPPYTFIATVNAVLMLSALPVFVDTDPETFQMDATKAEAEITDRTVAMLPVDLGGATPDMDALHRIAAKHKLVIVEDACQAHLGEWRGKKCGTLGHAGALSFQASKNLTAGEGGVLLCEDEDLYDRCYAFHTNGSGRKRTSASFSYSNRGANLRMTEFQAGVLLAQMTRISEQAKRREENAAYLSGMLKEIPGLKPVKPYEGVTRNAYHLYPLRFNAEAFGAPREKFLKALAAEGIPASPGYKPLNKEKFITDTLATRGYQRLFSKDRLARWTERNQLPGNERVCREAVWFSQNVLLGSRSDMDQIAEAARKIQAHAGEIARS